jgi:hypothetical protein
MGIVDVVTQVFVLFVTEKPELERVVVGCHEINSVWTVRMPNNECKSLTIFLDDFSTFSHTDIVH